MNIKDIRFIERWGRFRGKAEALVVFMLVAGMSVGFIFIASEPIWNPDVCRRIGRLSSGACTPGGMFHAVIIACLSGYVAGKLAFDVIVEFFQPLQSRAFSPVLRTMLLLKRLRVGRVVSNDPLEFDLLTLDDNHQPYRTFTFKVCGIRKFTFYEGDDKDVSPSCIFREGATLTFSHSADLTGLEYARVDVFYQYQGTAICGQLELEADSYQLQFLTCPDRVLR